MFFERWLPTSEDVDRAYSDGRGAGRREERERIRRELLALIESWPERAAADCARSALDLVCPGDHPG